MKVAGIDFDTNAVHVVVLELESSRAELAKIRLDVGPGGYVERARRARDVMPARGKWADEGVVMFGLEEPKSLSMRAAVPLAVIRGAILACLPRAIPVATLPPHEWKRLSLGGGFPGSGNAQKTDVRSWVVDRWRDRPPAADQNALDAYAIAWAARELYERRRANERLDPTRTFDADAAA